LRATSRRILGTVAASFFSTAFVAAGVLSVSPAQAGGLAASAIAASASTLAAVAPVIRDADTPAQTPALLAALATSQTGEHVREGRIERGDTLRKALARTGLSTSTAALVERQLRPKFDFRRLKSGHTYRLVLDSRGGLQSFHYKVSATEHYWLERKGKGWRAWREEADVRREQKRVAGVVTTSLSDAIEDLVGPSNERLAQDFAGIFAWDLDFSRGVQPGDQFEILYEKTYAPQGEGKERSLGPGRILAAHYRGAGGALSAVYFENEPGQGGYYRPDGTSVQGAFLAAPLNFSRITSSFSYARFHPILRRTRPHLGVDYAAPVGTPIWSVANGVVTYSGWMRGYGRMVKIQHAGGYETYYTHLSRFANGLRVGQAVRQKQVIGFVGSSGLATGPHTCFRITKDGSYVDPLRVRIEGRSGRIAKSEMAAFKTVRDRHLRALEQKPMTGTASAM